MVADLHVAPATQAARSDHRMAVFSVIAALPQEAKGSDISKELFQIRNNMSHNGSKSSFGSF